MKNKPRLILTFIIITFIALGWILYRYTNTSISALVLYALTYWLLCSIAYKRFHTYENIKNYSKASSILTESYTEVNVLHPHLLAIRYNMMFDGNIIAYAKITMGDVLNVKLVSLNQTYKIITNDWIWFNCNFTKKEPQ